MGAGSSRSVSNRREPIGVFAAIKQDRHERKKRRHALFEKVKTIREFVKKYKFTLRLRVSDKPIPRALLGILHNDNYEDLSVWEHMNSENVIFADVFKPGCFDRKSVIELAEVCERLGISEEDQLDED